MKKQLSALSMIAVLALAACGGGSDDGGSSDDGDSSSGDAATEQPAATITSEEICTAVPGEQFVPSVAEASGVIDTPSTINVSCSYQFANIDASVLDAQVIVENEGGQAGYDAYVADWSTRGDATEVPGLGDAATLVENSSVRRMIVLDGDRVVVINGPANDSFPFSVDVATEIAAAAVAAL